MKELIDKMKIESAELEEKISYYDNQIINFKSTQEK